MRQGPLSMLLCLLLLSPFTQAEEATPLSLSAGSQITELQQRLKESELQREALTQQLQNTDSERENAQLGRLRQENQRLKLMLKESQASTAPKLLTDQQQWFVIGSAVTLIAVLCGIFVSGSHRRRKQWLN
ncbi:MULTISPECIES: translation initiation factor 2 [unclassified Pseudomonas]|uniref:translation initiation factor 2 n=1 Tax=unclassified Pseudomonas TaxID=196821 RepID=UPI000BA2D11A|nr:MULTISPECIES: translation initiation factor 2 [unclassified Pseudomonas]MCU1719898.1 translation initiation factor 2 [Pseudomonas sp. 5P_5.1_Bac1]MCU1734423.1 translation initiation factor 2 [Pseudomonas sp. 20P_3.2_Bac4]MCU1746297.1 translation initiation factor 2 [Pseudomonas sp. 20P_3.2_Bac5]